MDTALLVDEEPLTAMTELLGAIQYDMDCWSLHSAIMTSHETAAKLGTKFVERHGALPETVGVPPQLNLINNNVERLMFASANTRPLDEQRLDKLSAAIIDAREAVAVANRNWHDDPPDLKQSVAVHSAPKLRSTLLSVDQTPRHHAPAMA